MRPDSAGAAAPDSRPERVLLIQLQQLGDVILTSTLLEDLREALPESRVDFLTRPRAALLLRGNPCVSDVVTYDSTRALRMPWRIRSRRYDCVVDVQSSPRSAQVTLLSGARRRIGWNISSPWRLAYTDRVYRDRFPEGWVVRERQRLLEPLGVAVKRRLPHLYLDPEERSRGQEEARSLGAAPGAPLVGLVLSAGAPASVWPVERFAKLATLLAADGVLPVVLVTRDDRLAVDRCLSLAGGAVMADVPELRRFLGLLAALDLLVCGDTGPVHMATALGIPTVTLYGPTHARNWNPGLPISGAVNSPREGCAACARSGRRSATDHTCMLEIEVESVHAGVREMLHQTAPRNR